MEDRQLREEADVLLASHKRDVANGRVVLLLDRNLNEREGRALRASVAARRQPNVHVRVSNLSSDDAFSEAPPGHRNIADSVRTGT